MTTVFGIKNCDTIKKTQKWLTNQGVEFEFHDYRKEGLDADWLAAVIAQFGWDKVVNKRGTTYRQLSDEQKEGLNAETAVPLLLESPAMIKRPIVEHNGQRYLGFDQAVFAEVFA